MRGDLQLKGAELEPEAGSRRLYQVIKRLLDLALSAVVLTFAAPLYLLIAALIKLDSPGPAIFRQQRVGRNGREFTMYKFRSMTDKADTKIHQERFRDYALNGVSENGDGSDSKDTQDDRVTRIGRFIRATNLDELPQMINVIKGEMSICGPRPAISYELQWYEDWHHGRFQVLPGITGLWQVSEERFKDGLDGMFRMDLKYIQSRSVFLDLKVIAVTLVSMLKELAAMRYIKRGRQ